MPRSREEDLKKNYINFTLFTNKIPLLERKMLTHDARRSTNHGLRRTQTHSKSHQSDPADLKINTIDQRNQGLIFV